MRITAFILSILLSTAALAKDYARADSDITFMEIDETYERGEKQFDREEITEEKRNRLIHSIDSIEAASNNGPISELSKLSRYAGECECAQGDRSHEKKEGGSIIRVAMAVGAIIGVSQLLFQGTIGSHILVCVILGALSGYVIKFFIESFTGDDNDICTKICSGEELQ